MNKCHITFELPLTFSIYILLVLCTIVLLYEDGSVLLELQFELTGYLRQSLIMFIQCTCMYVSK